MQPPRSDFDRIITTVPFSGARYVTCNPILSDGKRKAIRELHYDSSIQIALQFKKERFWKTRNNIVGGSSIT